MKVRTAFEIATARCGIPPYLYSVGMIKDDTLCILNCEGKTKVFIFERGVKNLYLEFSDEREAYRYAIRLLTDSREIERKCLEMFENYCNVR